MFRLKTLIIWINSLVRQMVINLIKFYQKTLSPDHGIFRYTKPYGHCRFRPTCSEYAITAISRYGVLRGGMKALWRVLRCNPFNQGGYDPVDKEDDKIEQNIKKNKTII